MPFKKNAQPDVPDARDWIYQPALSQLQTELLPPQDLKILNQHSEGACTGFSLAAVINRLNQLAGQDKKVSARMLYEMARRHDEWPGEQYDGSSLRGAIHGWKNMGVCKEDEWPFRVGKKGYLTMNRAREARKNTIGAYYRLRPVITDFHAALNEVGIIAVSAQVHKGWDDPKAARIKFYKRNDGGHAFAIVGYDEDGFIIQNSWGTRWGDNGTALWLYEDWIKNVMDAWVFRLALPSPQIFGMTPQSSVLDSAGNIQTVEKSAKPRSEIAGHFVHLDDGAYVKQGRYWSDPDDLAETARHVVEQQEYKHFLIYAHGGLNDPKASANRIAAMKDTYKKNGIYPFHIMYDTGLVEELTDMISRKGGQASGRVGGLTDLSDRFLQGLLRGTGAMVWREMKKGARDAFGKPGDGKKAIKIFKEELAKASRKIHFHLVGHSLGSVLVAHLLNAFRRHEMEFKTCSLMAPACSIKLYDTSYLRFLRRQHTMKLRKLTIYNLRDQLEKDDTVKVYQKSLLYLVSNAFERADFKPLLGMEKFVDKVSFAHGQPSIIYSDGVQGQRTRSKTHGGFDNDPYTMNNILKEILGTTPVEKFTKESLKD